MSVHRGDRVLVNVAPFIGSALRAKQSISCEVVDVEGARCMSAPNRRIVSFRCGLPPVGSKVERRKGGDHWPPSHEAARRAVQCSPAPHGGK